jgi:hypothetical protein
MWDFRLWPDYSTTDHSTYFLSYASVAKNYDSDDLGSLHSTVQSKKSYLKIL